MRRFQVFRHSSGAIEAVKQGWSWPASLFSVFWAPFKRMWVLGVGGLLATLALGYLVAAAAGAIQAASVMNLVLTVVSVVLGSRETLGGRPISSGVGIRQLAALLPETLQVLSRTT